MANSYLVTKDFDFSPRPNVVQSFKAGQIVSRLTRKCVAKGQSEKALKLQTEKE